MQVDATIENFAGTNAKAAHGRLILSFPVKDNEEVALEILKTIGSMVRVELTWLQKQMPLEELPEGVQRLFTTRQGDTIRAHAFEESAEDLTCTHCGYGESHPAHDAEAVAAVQQAEANLVGAAAALAEQGAAMDAEAKANGRRRRGRD